MDCAASEFYKDGVYDYTVFEGEKDDVEKLLRFCRKGPPGAVVTEVKIRWGDFRNEFKDFGIRYV